MGKKNHFMQRNANEKNRLWIVYFSCNSYILKAKSNFTLFIYIQFQDICEGYMKIV